MCNEKRFKLHINNNGKIYFLRRYKLYAANSHFSAKFRDNTYWDTRERTRSMNSNVGIINFLISTLFIVGVDFALGYSNRMDASGVSDVSLSSVGLHPPKPEDRDSMHYESVGKTAQSHTVHNSKKTISIKITRTCSSTNMIKLNSV
jgi:hypothetical protein